MQFGHLLAGGLLAAGLAVTAGDDLHHALMKLLHGGAQRHPESASPLDDGADAAALRLLHDVLGRLDLDGGRRAQLHERMITHATPLHEALAQLGSARDAHLRAVLAVPFDREALGNASLELATAQQVLARTSAELHATLRASLDDEERRAFDTARVALLSDTEARHAELRLKLKNGAFDPHASHLRHGR